MRRKNYFEIGAIGLGLAVGAYGLNVVRENLDGARDIEIRRAVNERARVFYGERSAFRDSFYDDQKINFASGVLEGFQYITFGTLPLMFAGLSITMADRRRN